MSPHSFKPGDLIQWTDHTNVLGRTFVGIYLRPNPLNRWRQTWADLIVLCNGDEVEWVSWQCELVNGS